MFTLDGIFINTLRVFVTVWIFSHLIRHRILQENFPRCATFESILVRICAIQNEIKKMFSFFLRVPVREVTLAKMSCGHCVVCRSHQRLLMYTVLSQNELKTYAGYAAVSETLASARSSTKAVRMIETIIFTFITCFFIN